jgi:hypothetical protein
VGKPIAILARGTKAALAIATLVLLNAGSADAFRDLPPVRALAVSPDSTRLYLASTSDGHIHALDIVDGDLRHRHQRRVCSEPTALALDRDNLWIACHGDRRIVILDSALDTKASLALTTEPADLLIDGSQVFVSAPRTRELLVVDRDSRTLTRRIALSMPEPRSLALDGPRLLVLGYRTGNSTTVLPGAVADRQQIAHAFNAASQAEAPAGGQNPAPNTATGFAPPLRAGLPRAPAVGLIVQKSDTGEWRDDAGRDWSRWIHGNRAPSSGRAPGWDLADRDLAIVDRKTLAPQYRTRLLTHGLTLAATDGWIAMAGIESLNATRFEPNLRGRFVRHVFAVGRKVDELQPVDANPHLSSRGQGNAAESIAELRAIALDPAKSRLFIAAAGSHVIQVRNLRGKPLARIDVAAEPVGLAMVGEHLVAYSRSAHTLSVIDRAFAVRQRVPLTPRPASALKGRRWLTDASLTSANGTQSCAGCHLDAHVDRLAWDLGDPSGTVKAFAGNCFTDAARTCADWHPMKGPMVTQSLLGIVGSEPFHWRGDRSGIHDFAQTYTGLLGRRKAPSKAQLDELRAYLALLRAPRNPYLTADGGLPGSLDLNEIAGIGTPREKRWPIGNAVRGLKRFREELLAPPFACAQCHAQANGLAPTDRGMAGGRALGAGPNGEAHHGLSSLTGLGQTFKIPALVGLHDKLGSDHGFGFGHDGSLLTLADFVRHRNLRIVDAQAEADILALLVAFDAAAIEQQD